MPRNAGVVSHETNPEDTADLKLDFRSDLERLNATIPSRQCAQQPAGVAARARRIQTTQSFEIRAFLMIQSINSGTRGV